VNPYAVLGIDPGASDTEIRRAYLALARRFHPDANPGGEERMRAINEAWAILGDRARRSAWDRDAEVPDPGFVPDDPTDDGFDPRAQPDVPYRPSTPRQAQRRGLLTMAPVALFAAAVGTGVGGIVFDEPAMLGVAVVVFSFACIAMIGVLLVAMVEARRDEG
jgi:curved DNA-binding protein CbpA